MSEFKSTFEYKLIYIFRINDEQHKGLLKIGDATVHTDKSAAELFPNCKELNKAAKDRINEYTKTASIEYELLYTELAIKNISNGGMPKAFRDKAVHNVLLRSGVKRHEFKIENAGKEWFKTDLETVKKAIVAVKEGRSSLNPDDVTEDESPIVFRPEQAKAIKDTITQFKKGDRMLWNAKMRFGKTLSALQVAKQMGFTKTLIFTHRPVVSDGWYDDFKKIFRGTDYVFGSKTVGEPIEKLVDGTKPYVYFCSIQDLRGSSAVGGKFDKNEFIFLIDWDYIVVDEAHEGTQTSLGQKVLEAVLEGSSSSKKPKLLELSGTPFNLLDSFKEGEIYTWDYIMEQRAKRDWPLNHFGDSNPYEELPKLEIFTYNLDKSIPGYIDVADGAFNFREFFRTWTGDINKDYKTMPIDAHIGDFVHRDDVLAFLNLLTKTNTGNNYPFATEEYRSYYRHTLWMVPGVKEAKALSKMLQSHPVFGSGMFNIVNVAGEGDEEQDSRDALQAVRNAIGTDPDDHYSITISCGRLTTGVTVPEWTAVFMLSGTFSTSAANYLQTIFRVQTPANINGRMKERCSVFDFAPDRTLKMVAEAGHLSSKTGNVSNDRVLMGEFLNFCPVVSIDGSEMKPYNVDGLLQQLKKAYTDRVVKNGFDDRHIYNDNLLKLDDIELKDFETLKGIIGTSKQSEKPKDIDINDQGFTDEEYDEIGVIQKKPPKERTQEEKDRLEELRKKKDSAQKAMSILRGISIRIPLLIYGVDVPVDQDITIDNFVDLIDDVSWAEFMPNGVTKAIYRKFSKYYEQDVFIAAGKQIRNMTLAADELSPLERVQKIATQFTMFKNPDKETVLTPWRVVNMHMSDCLGGWCFYNEDFTDTLEEPRLVDQGDVTNDTLANVNANILEINSKTGLYPLYVTYSIFRKRLDGIPVEERTLEKQYELWIKTVEENIFVICKTPMAKAITKRTLLGYRKGKVNAHAFDDLINQLKEKPQQFREKVLRGSTWGKKESVMKFNAVVGNPPYQVNTGTSTAQAIPVYNLFIHESKAIQPNYISIISPSRWFAGGMGLDSFREEMLTDDRLRRIVDFTNAKELFSSASIGGGVNYFLWDSTYHGKCLFTNNHDSNSSTRYRKLNEHDVFIRFNEAVGIVEKVIAYKNLCDLISPLSPFGINSSIRGRTNKEPGDLALISSGGITYITRSDVNSGLEQVDKYNVYISKVTSEHANEPNKSGQFKVLSRIGILSKEEVCTFSYFIVGSFDKKEEAQNLLAYLKTQFARFLLFQSVSSINLSKDKFRFVPIQDFTDKSDIDWSKSVAEIDQQLYAKYNLDETEKAFIESMIKPME